MIPRHVRLKTEDVENIKRLPKTLERVYEERLSIEFKDSPVKDLNLTKTEEGIRKIDRTIDQMVYELYRLTEEEISIIEDSFA